MKNLIIVTGGAGFVGSNLIKSLLKKTNKLPQEIPILTYFTIA